ncbi:MAG: response regulator transcription factor [Bacteroidia bacterium]|nr:response regulator transcription factor [Bacteroidia bacterium]
MNPNMKCIIVDDEYPARVLLQDYVSKIPQLELVKVCENAMEAMQTLQELEVDLMFLDIQMPDLTGLDLLRNLRQKPAVIFTTAYSEYALEGYQLDVLDYLLKPIPLDRFIQAVNKAGDFVELKRRAQSGSNQGNLAEKTHFFVSTGHKLERIVFADILHIEGLREYVRISTRDKRYVTLASMKGLMEELPEGSFLRVHKSWIVALDKVESMMGNSLEINGKLIPVSKTYKDEVLRKIRI